MTLNQLYYAIVVSKENSMNEAAKKLFISQPSLTGAMHSLENELGFDIFIRSKTGVTLTTKGQEFLGYARAVVEQYDILDAKFISKRGVKRVFGVSTQHYTFAVNAFIELVKEYGCDEYEFEIKETKTYDVIRNVKDQTSELGILYLNDFNRKVMSKVFSEEGVVFTPLFECSIYAYLSKENPLAAEKLRTGETIKLEELDDYPCLCFNQGEHNSSYYAEEVLNTRDYARSIKVCDRATMLNLIKGLNGYTLCSGIICEDLNGDDYCAIKLDLEDKMTIGYISRKEAIISDLGQKYLEEISKYKENILA
ncbi:MAG: LysR family transcriptional regulator [Butyrivibrio sp.]|nr:LysR family transcriptional regulator [Butyrivibrio sp.]